MFFIKITFFKLRIILIFINIILYYYKKKFII